MLSDTVPLVFADYIIVKRKKKTDHNFTSLTGNCLN